MTTTAARTEAVALTALSAISRVVARLTGWTVHVMDIALPTAWRPAPRTAPAPDPEHAEFIAQSEAALATFTAALTTIRNRVPLHVVDAPRSVALDIVVAPAPTRKPARRRTRSAKPAVMASAARTTTAPAMVTVAELRRQATARGHKGVSRLAKAALIALLTVADPAPAADPVPTPVVVAPAAESAPAPALPRPMGFVQLARRASNADLSGRFVPLARRVGILTDARFMSVLTDAERARLATVPGYTEDHEPNARFLAHAGEILADAGKRPAPVPARVTEVETDPADGVVFALLADDGGRHAVVDARLYSTLCRRHPSATPRLNATKAAEKPVVWLDADGKPVALLMPRSA